MESAVSLSGLVKTFKEHRAVDGLSFEVPAGEIFGLLGRNGAGKTTTIRMIMDIIRPDSGRIRVLGQDMHDGLKDRIGYLPEERGLYPKMKIQEVLIFQGSIQGLTRADARSRVGGWLERLELGKWADKKVEDLSKGMQQKLQFIAAVIAEPELLILDEPFSGMDPVNQELFKDLILELNRKGCTIIFSTHVMDSAERLCQEIALIDKGRAVLNGTVRSIKQQFGGPLMAAIVTPRNRARVSKAAPKPAAICDATNLSPDANRFRSAPAEKNFSPLPVMTIAYTCFAAFACSTTSFSPLRLASSQVFAGGLLIVRSRVCSRSSTMSFSVGDLIMPFLLLVTGYLFTRNHRRPATLNQSIGV